MIKAPKEDFEFTETAIFYRVYGEWYMVRGVPGRQLHLCGPWGP